MLYQQKQKILKVHKIVDLIMKMQLKKKKKSFRYLLIFLLIFINTLFYSQDISIDYINRTDSFKQSINYIEITGTITEVGFPLSDIIVLEKGTTNAVISDKNGKFSIKIPIEKFKTHVYLRFESLVMETKEIEVFQVSKNLNISMKSNDLKRVTSELEYNSESLKIDWNTIINNNIKTQLNKERDKHIRDH